MKYYPLQFHTILKEKVWGGRNLEQLNKNLPKDIAYGESWEISAHPDDSSIITNGFFKGKTLPEVLKEHGKQIVGEQVWEKYEHMFPLLVKFLDINDRLSIQVHPSDMYSIPVEKSFGKAECWYIFHASDDAKLTMGMKPGVTKEIFLEKTKNNDFSNLFEEITVKTGDLVVIKPGMVHSSLTGSILISEIQQNSDITYRIYDFDRLDNGVKRPLHLEKAADVIDFNAKADIQNFSNVTDTETTLLDWEYFHLKRLVVSGIMERPVKDVMRLYSVIDGSLDFVCGEEKLSLTKGSSLLLPANLSCTLSGNTTLMEAHP